MALYFLPTNPASILFSVICIVDFIVFHFKSKTHTNSKIRELKNSYLSEDINHDRSNELKNLIKSIIEEWNFNLDQTKEYNLNQREYFEYEPDRKRPEFDKKSYEDYIKNMKLNTSTPEQMYNDYINEEIAFYDKVNAHNKATAEYKTQKKLEKLKSLTLEQLEKINGYVTKINEIAEKYGIENRIKFDQAEFLEWQKQQTEEQTDNVPQQDNQKQQDNHIIISTKTKF